MQIHRNLSAHITVLISFEIKNDGTLAEILTKYFGKDTSPADDDLKATPN